MAFDTKKLRELADRAGEAKEKWYTSYTIYSGIATSADADFIAAANPTVIKALLDALDCHREALDELASEGNVKAHNARAKAAQLLGQGG